MIPTLVTANAAKHDKYITGEGMCIQQFSRKSLQFKRKFPHLSHRLRTISMPINYPKGTGVFNDSYVLSLLDRKDEFESSVVLKMLRAKGFCLH